MDLQPEIDEREKAEFEPSQLIDYGDAKALTGFGPGDQTDGDYDAS